MQSAIMIGTGYLDGVTQKFYENVAMLCYYNDSDARDKQAHIQKTYNNGRFSEFKTVMGINAGKWYCCYKKAALVSLNKGLDS